MRGLQRWRSLRSGTSISFLFNDARQLWKETDIFGKASLCAQNGHKAPLLSVVSICYSYRITLKSNSPLPSTTVRCPRIYKEFERVDGTLGRLTFTSPSDSHKHWMFLGKAAVTETEEEQVLIKLVQGNYGKDAHQIAAQHGFAPQLHGTARLDGAPNGHIMECLDKRSWHHPRGDMFSLPTNDHYDKLEAEINRFLKFLTEKRLVHGDLRANNMYIRVQDDKVELRILDWDWAGKAGVARYPINLNPAANLPGGAGELIYPEHDRTTIMKHFNQFKRGPE